MSNKSKRIRVNLNNNTDKHIKLNLNQDIEEFNILSLKLTQEDIYNSFNSDFGVIVGRVNGNDNVGIPNVRVSIFIPISDEDKNNPNIVALYPYESPRDLNKFNKRYNLLPRTSILDENGNYKPKQPFGSFPNKAEISVDETYLEIYEKYYKYTTITNDSGDYMLFGVPTGIQTVHISVDITDIGQYSMSPIEMIQNLGYSENLFTEDGFNIITQERLEDLPNIETQEIAVDVIPFWGDNNNFEIGITRQDFNIKAQIKSSAIIFGTIGTMGEPCVIGSPFYGDRRVGSFYYTSPENEQNIDIRTLRGSNNLRFRLYTYPSYINESDIDDDLNTNFSDSTDYYNNRKINPASDIVEVDESEYYYYVNDGFFVLVVNCNRDKKITNELGELENVEDDNQNGVFTKFLGMILVDYEDDEANLNITQNHNGDTYYGDDKAFNTRGILKIPQSDYSLMPEVEEDDSNYDYYLIRSEKWRKTYFPLELGCYYSISQFFPTTYIKEGWYTNNLSDNSLISYDNWNRSKIGGFLFRVKGHDVMGDYQFKFDNVNFESFKLSGTTDIYSTYEYDFPHNKAGVIKNIDGLSIEQHYFGGQWINMFMVLPQYSYAKDYTTFGDERDMMVATMMFGDNDYYYRNNYFLEHRLNTQLVFGGLYGSNNIIRGDTFKTDLVKIELDDLPVLNNINNRSVNGVDYSLSSNFKYQSPNNSSIDTEYQTAYDDVNKGPYIFKGFYLNDSVRKLYELNFI